MYPTPQTSTATPLDRLEVGAEYDRDVGARGRPLARPHRRRGDPQRGLQLLDRGALATGVVEYQGRGVAAAARRRVGPVRVEAEVDQRRARRGRERSEESRVGK